jgi:transcriptional regulator GlxA family with amidase domain
MKGAVRAMPDVTVVVLAGAYASSVGATTDLLRAVEVLAPQVGVPPLTWRVCSVAGGDVELTGGLRAPTIALPGPTGVARATGVVPGRGVENVDALDHRLASDDVDTVARRVGRRITDGRPVAASCASVFVLQRAGALAGRRATTTWWLAGRLQSIEPTCRVVADKMVCADGPMVTGGAAFAHADLMLHVIRERRGARLTRALSRALLVDGRLSQARYVAPEVLASGDALVSAIVDLVERRIESPPSVAELAAGFAVSERTLARRVRAATGLGPLALVNAVRVRRADDLLATTTMSVDQVATAVGYQDATALRRMTRRTLGVTPSALRQA